MTTHAANLARLADVKCLRWEVDPKDLAVHIEDVLTRHAPTGPWSYANCDEPNHENRFGVSWPCPDYMSALRLLDALDGGVSDRKQEN